MLTQVRDRWSRCRARGEFEITFDRSFREMRPPHCSREMRCEASLGGAGMRIAGVGRRYILVLAGIYGAGVIAVNGGFYGTMFN